MSSAARKELFVSKLRALADEAREAGVDLIDQIKTPERLRGKVDAADRVGQIIAFFFIGPVVVVSLRLIVVLNLLMTDILGVSSLGSSQNDIFAWLVTAITGGAFLLAAYAWFQFVRTAGLGWFSWGNEA